MSSTEWLAQFVSNLAMGVFAFVGGCWVTSIKVDYWHKYAQRLEREIEQYRKYIGSKHEQR